MKIDRIDLFVADYPFVGYFKFIRGPAVRKAVLVKITADDGTVGWGQSVPVVTWSYETIETAEIVLRDYFGPALIGHDPCDLAGAEAILDRVLAPAFSTGMPITRAGMDLALHDLAGKLQGKSLAELWGKPPGGPVTLSWTLDVRSLDEIEPEIARARNRGYQHFNVKIGSQVENDLELVRRIRRAAPDSVLWADANGGYDLDAALAVAPKLADLGVEVLESPLRPNRISGYQAIKRQGALPITMDEGVVSAVELEEFIRLGMIDGITLKVSRCGGLASARRQIEVALGAGLFFLGSGLTDPDISLAASLGLYSLYGLSKPAALNGPQFLPTDVLASPLAIRGDQAQPPAGPGLGIEVDEGKLAAMLAGRVDK